MSRFANRSCSSVTLLAIVFLASSAHAATGTWSTTAANGNLSTGTNWSVGGPISTVAAGATADTLTFDTTTVAGSFLSQNAANFARNITFNAGASAYTWNASGLGLTMGSTTNATTLGSITNNSSNVQIINMGGSSGVLGLNGSIAGTGDVVINGAVTPGQNINNASTGLFLDSSGNTYFNVDTSINPNGNVSAAAWPATSNSASRGITHVRGSGRVFLGNIGSSYIGRWVLDGTNNGNLRLTHNSALGSNGASSNARIDILGGTTGNTTMELAGGISVARITVFLEGRSGAVANDPHFLNVSGNNTFTISGDWDSENNNSGNWNFQSDAGKMTFATGNVYNTGTGATTLQLMGAGNGEFDGSLVVWTNNSPSLNVVKNGTGTWTFSDIPAAGGTTVTANTVMATPTSGQVSIHTGTFAANQGTLEFKPLATGNKISLSATSSLAVADGAKLKISPFNTSSTAVTSASSLALGSSVGGSTIDFNLLGTPSAVPLSVNAFTTTGAAGTNLINVASANTLTIGSFPLISYTGGSIGGAGGFGSLAIGSLPLRTTANLVDTGTSVDLNVSLVDSIRWDGTTNVWNINSAANWKLITAGTTTTYLQPSAPGEPVTFDDNAAGNLAINATVPVNPSSMTFNNTSAKNYSFSGAGITTTAMSMNDTGNVTVTGGNFTVTGSLALNGSGTLTFDTAGAVSVAGGMSGAGALVKKNTNNVDLSSDNSAYTGTATVEAGKLRILSPNSLTATTVQNNATLSFETGAAGVVAPGGGTKAVSIIGNGASGTAGALVGVSTSGTADVNPHIGNLTLAGDATIAATNNGGTGRSILWFDGAVNGNNNNLTAFVDTSVNAASEIDFLDNGVTNINNLTITGGGALYIGKNTDLGSTGSIILGDSVTLTNGRFGLYTATASASTVGVSKPISVTAGTVGGLEFYYDANLTVDSPIAINGDRLDVIPYTRTSSTTSKLTLSNSITGAGGLGVHCEGTTTTSRLGTVFLTNDNNTFAGPITIGGGGGIVNTLTTVDRISLQIGADIVDGGPTGSIGPGDITITPSANIVSSLLLNRTGSYTLTNNINLNSTNAAARIQAIGAGDPTISGAISGGGRIIVNNAAGSLTLSGNNTFTGSTVASIGILDVQTGHLIAASNNALGENGTPQSGYVQLHADLANTSALLLTNNATVGKAVIYLGTPRSINDANVGPHIISVTGSNELTGTIATDGTSDATNKFYTFQSNTSSNLKLSGEIRQDYAGEAFLTLRGAGNGEVSGSITQPSSVIYNGNPTTGNSWSLIKEGSGTWKLTGTMAHTGTTTVNNGTLLVNTSHTVGGAYVVNGDTNTSTFGKLGGTGTITEDVTVNANGTLAPGASVGTFTVGSAVFNTDTVTNGKLLIEYDGDVDTIDKLIVTGALDITNATLDFDNLGVGALNGSPKIFASYGAGLLTGTFTSPLDLPGGYTIDYNYLSGNQIALVGGPAGVPGDYNGNGVVDGADYVVWRKHNGQIGGGTPSVGDGTGDGNVTTADYNYWRARFGNTSGSGSSLDGGQSVPEPATCGLVLCAMLGVLSGRRRNVRATP